jgi:hypothetical protein
MKWSLNFNGSIRNRVIAISFKRAFFGESLAVVTQLMLDLQDLLQFGAS